MAAPWLDDALATLAGVHEEAAQYDCPDPTPDAVVLAEQVVRALAVYVRYPKPHICSSADGGVGIVSRAGDLMVFIEADNECGDEGEEEGACVVFCASNKVDWPKAVEAAPEQFAEYAADTARFLLAGVPVPWEGSQVAE